MDSGGVAGGDTGEGHRRDPLVRKGRGVAGIDPLAGADAEAQFPGQVADVVGEGIFAGAAGNEFAHDAADHVQIDVQHHVGKFPFVGGAVGLGAKQTPLLAAAPDEAQAVAVGIFGEILRHGQQADAAGHIVVCALREGRGVVVGGEHDGFGNFAWQVQNDVPGFALVFRLLQDDFRRGGPGIHNGDGVLGVDVHAGDLIPVGYAGSQLPLVHVVVNIVGVAVVGDEAHGPVGEQVLIDPVTQVAVDEDDFALAAAQGAGVLAVPQVVEGGLHRAASGIFVALAGIFLAVQGQGGFLQVRHLHGEGLDDRLAEGGAAGQEIFGAAQLLRAAAGTNVGRVLENFHDLFASHILNDLLKKTSVSMLSYFDEECKEKIPFDIWEKCGMMEEKFAEEGSYGEDHGGSGNGQRLGQQFCMGRAGAAAHSGHGYFLHHPAGIPAIPPPGVSVQGDRRQGIPEKRQPGA